MANPARALLLDTYVWIWLVNGDPVLGADALAAIERAAADGSGRRDLGVGGRR